MPTATQQITRHNPKESYTNVHRNPPINFMRRTPSLTRRTLPCTKTTRAHSKIRSTGKCYPITHPTRVAIQNCNIIFSRKLVLNIPGGKIIHELSELLLLFVRIEQIIYPDHAPWTTSNPIINTKANEIGNKHDQEQILKTTVTMDILDSYSGFVKIYSVWSKTLEPSRTVSAAVIPERNIQIGVRLPDYCSIYITEFMAFAEDLKRVKNNDVM
ncbi:hypothetical protein CHS0354_010950 [Potamilus streckersoni]|uniref:Uncharacterized protein n=1 Tax=Potamilus streckersoni TaxID=2493646 RepID=A0AAE0W1Z6_9BIVA|nr:hypothetical protein CHS0354_010950 [Potamilus streckersoni]